MKLSMTKNGTPRYYFAKLSWGERFDPKEIEMLTANTVPSLIVPEAVQGRKNNVIQYNISPYSTLEFYLTCILSKEQFADLLLQCIRVFQQMQRVYLNYKNLVCDLDQIFILLADRSVHFIYLPLANSKREMSYASFFRRIIRKASRSTYEQVSFLDACMTWLDRPASFTLEEFERFVKSGGGAEPQQPAAPYGQQPPAVQPWAGAYGAAPQEYQPNRTYQPRPQPPAPPACPPLHPAQGDPGAAVIQADAAYVDEDSGGTVLLTDEVLEETPPLPVISLLREKTGETIRVQQFPFLIGTEAGKADYCVSGNATISRRHAMLDLMDGACVLIDQKSTNKTYINDCLLEPLTAYSLKNGDRLRLAKETFIFTEEG